MPRRLFRCPSCGHRLRFGATTCGKCYLPTPFYNRKLPFWLALLVIPVAGLIVVAT
ncbi:zinc ribbon domain-containing protein [Marinovum sp.]|uniref:zinc ribbon domain-containing protein n=1 Tax=Marinovum sp. TaxID=2024839 RepID=UPI002B27A739|nr:zinc ribbon domain-containing protein [Marinovum sp.]